MKHANQPKVWTPAEAVHAIQHANVSMTTVVAVACCNGRAMTKEMGDTADRIFQKSRDATDAKLGDRLGDKTTWADVRTMLTGFCKILIEEMEAANK